MLAAASRRAGVARPGSQTRTALHQPPPRYTEASLVAELEKRGIGRPSTYATILSVIQDRDYVETKERKFYPTELGRLVSDLLVEHFPDVMDVEFTAAMENLLDQMRRAKTVGGGAARFL